VRVFLSTFKSIIYLDQEGTSFPKIYTKTQNSTARNVT